MSEDVVAEATSMGWTPKEEWRGDPEKWVDAETFVERGNVVLPILRKANQELHGQLTQLNGQLQQVMGELKAQKTAMDTIQEAQAEELAQRVAEARKELAAQIREARENNDTELELKLLDQRDELNAEVKASKDKKGAAGTEGQPPAKTEPETPEYKTWVAENPQLHTDAKFARRAYVLALEIAEESGGKLVGKPFYDELDKRLAALNGKAPRVPSRVAPGTPSGGGGNGGEGGSSYADLPADAKKVCDDQARKFVGEGKRYKDIGAWRKTYAQKYFAQP